MSFTSERIQALIRNGETEQVEFKTTIKDSKSLAKLIASFANSHGGVILVGIQEPNIIIGVDESKLIRHYNEALSQLNPKPQSVIEFVSFESKPIGIISVSQSDLVILSTQGVYIRRNASTLPMTEAEIVNKIPKQDERLQEEMRNFAKALEANTKTIEEQGAIIRVVAQFRMAARSRL